MIDIGSLQLYVHLLVAALALVLPGTAVYLLAQQALDANRDSGRLELIGLALRGSFLSIAFWPLLLLYASLAGLRFTPAFVWGVLLICALYLAYRVAQTINRPAPTGSTSMLAPRLRLFRPRVPRLGWAINFLALGGMTALALAFRLGDAQGLVVPMFGDSLHHTMITTIIMSTGQVPTGYAPFVPVDTFTYHFGFHTLAATFGLLSGSSAPYSVLLIGQALIVMAVPGAYILNRQLFNTRLAGLGAALLTGFVSLMPNYYINWGRYTQLAGQVLLMAALTFVVRAMSAEWKRSDVAITAFCVAGLIVVHYRVLIFFGLFGLALGAWQLITMWGRWKAVWAAWGRGLLAVAIGLIATSTWVYNLATNYLPGLAGRLSTVTSDYLAQYNNPGALPFYVGLLLPAIGLAGVVIAVMSALSRRAAQSGGDSAAITPPYFVALVVAMWMALLIASLWVVPGAIGSYTVAITLYIPLSALGGYAVAWACRVAGRLLSAPPTAFALGILVAAPVLASFTGASHVADPAQFAYVQPADLRAFNWIKANTPPDAKFLISSEFSYAGRGVTASDAGMWLPLLAGRNVSVPALSAWMERPVSPSFFTDTRKLAAYTQPTGGPGDSDQPALVSRDIIPAVQSLSDPQPLALMQQLGITYVYSGAAEGKSAPRLDIAIMRKDSRHYKLVYFDSGVYVFQVMYYGAYADDP